MLWEPESQTQICSRARVASSYMRRVSLWMAPVAVLVPQIVTQCHLIFLFFKDMTYLFLERGEGREKEGEKHPCVIATSISSLLCVSRLGTEPTTCMCPDRNQTCHLLPCRMMPRQLSHIGQG